MLCAICHGMLNKYVGRIGTGSQLQLSFRHHIREENVQASAKAACYLCRVIWKSLRSLNVKVLGGEQVDEARTFLSATLRSVPRWPGVYLLDFKAKNVKEVIASFVLKRTDAGESSARPTGTISGSTSSPEVFALAKGWIEQCASSHEKCRPASETPWYPTRLIDMQQMLDSNKSTEAVRLVSQKEDERRSGQPPIEGKYVTLSHRWGKVDFTKLTRETLPDFQNAILLKDLPLTFRDAIKFSCELGVRWLWIDAMCILQKDDKDWLFESARMDMVYTHSYCNISATAAMDSSKGLFNNREQLKSWVENVNLKTDDLEGDSQSTVNCTILDLSFWQETVDNAPVNRRSWVFQERILAPRVLHWCQDQIAFECRESDKAECRPEGLPHFQMKRGELIDGARLKGVDSETGKRLREIRLRPKQSMSSSQRVKEMAAEIDPKFNFYELWKRVVEIYSKMDLTQERDRLIALSGIARMMTSTMMSQGIKDEYIAGMWKNYMASQLLWYVNEGDGKVRQPFDNTRPTDYRAPTFSWASVETARGITFAETMDKGLLITVEVVRLTYRTEDDMFGLLTDGYLVLRGVLRKIELTDAKEDTATSISSWNAFVQSEDWEIISIVGSVVCFAPILVMLIVCGILCLKQHWALITTWVTTCAALSISCLVLRTLLHQKVPKTDIDEGMNRYYWRLVKEGKPVGRKYETVYLDSPASAPSIFGPKGQVFCLPAAKDDRHLNCLLVQAADGDYGVRYRRIGLTTIQTIYPDVADITTPPGNNNILLGRYYWGPDGKKTGESTICII